MPFSSTQTRSKVLHFFILLGWAALLRGFAAESLPVEKMDQPWRVVSLKEDAGLEHCNVFNLDFERDRKSARWGNVWLATSVGLCEYDGYHWRRYGVADGLPSAFVRCVLVRRNGQIWVGTDKGAGVYEKGVFRTMGSEAGLAGPNVRRIIEDADGVVWFCSDSWPTADKGGGITSWQNGRWRAYHLSDGLPSEYVVNYFRDRNGRRFAVTLAGLAELVGERWKQVVAAPAGQMVNFGSGCVAEGDDGRLLFFTGREIFLEEGVGVWKQLPNSAIHEHGVCRTTDGLIVAGVTAGSGRKALSSWKGGQWQRLSAEYSVSNNYNEDVQEAPDGSIWVVGFDCVTRWQRHASEWSEFAPAPPPVFVDGDNRVWFAAFKGRLNEPSKPLLLEEGRWRQLDEKYDRLIREPRGGVWGWNSNSFTHWVGGRTNRFGPGQTQVSMPTSGSIDNSGNFWAVGSNSVGGLVVSKFDGTNWSKMSAPTGLGSLRSSGICRPNLGVWMLFDPGGSNNLVAANFGSATNESVEVPRSLAGLFDQEFFLDEPNSTLWMFGETGLHRRRLGGGGNWEQMTNQPGRKVIGLQARSDGLWVACSGSTGGGKGGFARLKDGVWSVLPMENLLSFSKAADGRLFWGGAGHFGWISNGSNSVANSLTIPDFDLPSAVVSTPQGDCWMGNGERVFRFRSNEVLPDTEISAQTTNVIQGNDLQLSVSAIERFMPSQWESDCRVSWRIDGGAWSATTLNGDLAIPTRNLASGVHLVEAVARHPDGDFDPTPAVLAFRVYPLPLQSRSWFAPAVGTSMLALLGLTFTAFSARLKLAGHARLLESRVAERTAELEADIAERVAVQTALGLSEHRLRLALTAARLGVWELDWPGQKLIWSIDCTAIFGRPNFSGRREEFQQFLHPEDAGWVSVSLDEAVSKRALYEAEFRIILPDGSVRWVSNLGQATYDSRGEPLQVVGTVQDITARKDAEAEIERQKTQLQFILDNVPALIFCKDRQHRLVWVNQEHARTKGMTREALEGRTDEELGSPYTARYLADGEEVMGRGVTKRVIEPLTTKTGVRWLQTDKRPYRDSAGEIVGMLGFAVDITERLAAEEGMKMAILQLRVLIDCNQAMARAADEVSLLEEVCRIVVETGGYKIAWVGYASQDHGKSVEVMAQHGSDLAALKALTFSWDGGSEHGQGAAGTSIREAKVAVLRDFTTNPRTSPWSEAARKAGLGSVCSLPLAIDGTVIGCFAIYSSSVEAFSENEIELLRELAQDVSFGVAALRTQAARQRAEASMRLFRLLLDRATDAIFVLDASDGRVVDANATACGQCGYSREEMLGTYYTSLISPEVADSLENHVAEVREKGSIVIERMLRRKDETSFPAEISVTYFSEGPDAHLLAISRDITQRKLVEKAMEERLALEKTLSMVVASVPGVVYSFRMRPDGSFCLPYASPSIEDLYGLRPDQLATDAGPLLAMIHPGDAAHLVATIQESARTLTPWREEYRARHPERGEIWVEGRSSPVREADGGVLWSGFVHEITQRKQAEDMLRHSEERFREVVENIDEVFWMEDLDKANVIFVSKAYQKIWGRDPALLYADASEWKHAIHTDDLERVNQALQHVKDGSYDVTYRVVRPDGTTRWIHDRAFPIHNPDGSVTRVAGIAEDITDHRVLEEQLLQSRKMEAIGQLSGGVAHDFNNILTVIHGHAGLLEMHQELPKDVRESSSEIMRAAERAANLTRQLLMFSRQQPPELREVNLNESVGNMTRMLQRILGEDIQMQFVFATKPLYLHADPGMIDQILLNLAVNSRDAMPRGGKLIVQTTEAEFDEGVTTLWPNVRPGNFACLSVSDTGCGIPPDVMPRIFEPFFTTKQVGKGTGLGLATVFGIVQQHFGWIEVASQVGVGTTFKIFIPLCDAPAGQGRRKPLSAVRGGSETILVVEDETPLRVLVCRTLAKLGYHVLQAASGPQALALWPEHADKIDLLVTDMVMPEGMTGAELASRLLREKPGLKVLFSSGYSAELAAGEVVVKEGINFLPKPYHPHKLAEAVRTSLDS